MSQKSLVPLNVLASATAPTTPTLRAGDLYFNTTDQILYGYTGSAWVASSSSSSGGFVAQNTSPTNTSLLWVDTGAASLADAGGVQQVVAGTNVTLSPTNGYGVVTVNASASSTVSVNAPITNAGTSTAANLSVSTGSTSAAGVLQLTDSTSSTSTTTAATPNSVKSAYDAAIASVQTTLTISTTAPLSGGGNLSANRTFSIDTSSDQLLLASQIFG